MKSLLFAALLLLLTSHRHAHGSLTSLANMIQAVTGKLPMAFEGYGNYCGPGGSGQPVDNIDKCCQGHDSCYFQHRHECNMTVVDAYLAEYVWTLPKASNKITCRGLGATEGAESMDKSCEISFCECDRTLANCLRRNLRHYNKQRLSKHKVWRKVLTKGWRLLNWLHNGDGAKSTS